MNNPENILILQVAAGVRTYFIDVKETREGSRYITISESKRLKNGEYEKHRIMIFEDHIYDFTEALNEALMLFPTINQTETKSIIRLTKEQFRNAYKPWRSSPAAAAGRPGQASPMTTRPRSSNRTTAPIPSKGARHVLVEDGGPLRIDKGRVLIAKLITMPADGTVSPLFGAGYLAVELLLHAAPRLPEDGKIRRVLIGRSEFGRSRAAADATPVSGAETCVLFLYPHHCPLNHHSPDSVM